MTGTPVYHYTFGHKWPAILTSGHLDLARGSLDVKERPAVWFSSREDYEPTAIKDVLNIVSGRRYRLTVQECIDRCDGMYRVKVSREGLLSWTEFRASSGISSAMARRLIDNGRKWGANPGDWFASYRPIKVAEWLSVERCYVRGQWEAVSYAR